jgi:hypothetical protein
MNGKLLPEAVRSVLEAVSTALEGGGGVLTE